MLLVVSNATNGIFSTKNVITIKKISNFRLVFDFINFFVLVSCFNYLSNQYFVVYLLQ